MLLRVISYYFSIPVNFREFELFSPTIYGANMILKTLGDLLINSLLFVWIILFSRSMINRYKLRLNFSSPAIKYIGCHYGFSDTRFNNLDKWFYYP